MDGINVDPLEVGQELLTAELSRFSSTFFVADPSVNLESALRLDWLSIVLWGSLPVSAPPLPPAAGVIDNTWPVDAGDLNSGPHPCVASTVSTEPSPTTKQES